MYMLQQLQLPAFQYRGARLIQHTVLLCRKLFSAGIGKNHLIYIYALLRQLLHLNFVGLIHRMQIAVLIMGMQDCLAFAAYYRSLYGIAGIRMDVSSCSLLHSTNQRRLIAAVTMSMPFALLLAAGQLPLLIVTVLVMGMARGLL